MKVKKVVTLAGVALLLFYVITQPHEAAAGAQVFLGWLRDGAEAIILFCQNVTR